MSYDNLLKLFAKEDLINEKISQMSPEEKKAVGEAFKLILKKLENEEKK